LAKNRRYSSIRKNSKARGWWRTRRGWRRLAGRAGVAAGVVAVAAVLILAVRSAGSQSSGASPEKLISREAPGFTLSTLKGDQVELSDFRGKKNVLLFFNEGYGCAPCWQQAVTLQENLDKFAALGTEVFAIMVDPPDLLKQEAARWDLTLPILVDSDTRVSQAYDALGGMHADKPNHAFVLVDKTGVVRWSRDYPSMQADNASIIEQVQAVGG
jgi:peroxiredoxin